MADDKQLAFKKDDYDKLIKFYDDDSDAIVKELMRDHDTETPRLEEALLFKPGSQGWDAAEAVSSKVKTLAAAFGTQYTTLEKKYADFAVKLSGARDVFDDTDDLAKYKAQDFVTNYLGDGMNVVGRPPKK